MHNRWDAAQLQPFNLNSVVDNKVVWGTLEFIPIGYTKYSYEETSIVYWIDGVYWFWDTICGNNV